MTRASQQQIELEIVGMTCDSCALHVTKALEGIAEVSEVHVPGWTSSRATVVADTGVSEEIVAQVIKDAGYRAKVLNRRDITAPVQPEGWGHKAAEAFNRTENIAALYTPAVPCSLTEAVDMT